MRFFFHFNTLAIDCTWEEWGEWSSCPDVCGISRVFRSREKNEHICGGVACTGKSSDEKHCDRFADLKLENDECQQNFFNSTEEIERLKMCFATMGALAKKGIAYALMDLMAGHVQKTYTRTIGGIQVRHHVVKH